MIMVPNRAYGRWTVLCPRLGQQHGLTHDSLEPNPSFDDWKDPSVIPHWICTDGWDVWFKLARPDPWAAKGKPSDTTGAGTDKQMMTLHEYQYHNSNAETSRLVQISSSLDGNLLAQSKSRNGRQQNQAINTKMIFIEVLPPELRNAIITYLEFPDLISLAQSCIKFFYFTRTYLHDTLLSSLSSWAGHEIAAAPIIGLNKLPSSFSHQELLITAVNKMKSRARQHTHRRIENLILTGMKGYDNIGLVERALEFYNQLSDTAKLYGAARLHFAECSAQGANSLWPAEVPRVENILSGWRWDLEFHVPPSCWDQDIPEAFRTEIRKAASGEHFFPPGTKWVLRDMDKHEIIRCHATSRRHGFDAWVQFTDGRRFKRPIDGLLVGSLQIDQLLLVRIMCDGGCEDTPYVYRFRPGPFCRDYRAGHRFEIISERMHDREVFLGACAGGPSIYWRDVTNAALRQALEGHWRLASDDETDD